MRLHRIPLNNPVAIGNWIKYTSIGYALGLLIIKRDPMFYVACSPTPTTTVAPFWVNIRFDNDPTVYPISNTTYFKRKFTDIWVQHFGCTNLDNDLLELYVLELEDVYEYSLNAEKSLKDINDIRKCHIRKMFFIEQNGFEVEAESTFTLYTSYYHIYADFVNMYVSSPGGNVSVSLWHSNYKVIEWLNVGATPTYSNDPITSLINKIEIVNGNVVPVTVDNLVFHLREIL